MAARNRPHSRMFAVILFACAALLAGGCASGATPRRLTQADDGQLVELRPGERLEVTLAGNPTTGYLWEVAEVDSAVLRLVGKVSYHQEGAGIGAGGVFTATLEAVAAGRTDLRLVYQRPFERDQPPAQAFAVRIVVQ